MDSWHLMVYTTSTAYGLLVLVNVSLSGFVDKLSEELDLQEPYFLNLSQCYSGYPSKVMLVATEKHLLLVLLP